jgi:hypothetical protein
MLNKEEYDFVKRSGTVLGDVAMLAMVVSNGGSAFRVVKEVPRPLGHETKLVTVPYKSSPVSLTSIRTGAPQP